jgi:competence protein ComEC
VNAGVIAPLLRRTDVGPVAVALGAVGGARVAEVGAGRAAGPLLAAGLLALGAAWLVGGVARVAIGVVAVALLAHGAMGRALDGLTHHALATAVERGQSLELEGMVAGDPAGYRWSAEVLVRVARFRTAGEERWTDADRIVLAVATDEASRFRVLEVGDRVTISGYANPLSGIDARWRWRHAVAAVTAARLVHVRAPRGMHAVAGALRDVVIRGASLIPSADGALLAGFLLGETGSVPERVLDDFEDSGLTHLLAVSGANVAFVLVLAGPFLRRFGLGARCALGAAAVVVFAVVTHWEPSVLRAAAMATCAMGAVFVGRPISSLRLLAYAVVVLVIADPFLVHSVAFALSCAATLGIVLLAAPLRTRLRGPELLRDALSITLAAQVGVAPVLIAVFGEILLVAPLANLLAVPVAEPVTVLGLPLAVAAGLLSGVATPLGRVLVMPVGALVAWVRNVAAAGAAASTATTLAVLAIAALGVIAPRLRARTASPRRGGRPSEPGDT